MKKGKEEDKEAGAAGAAGAGAAEVAPGASSTGSKAGAKSNLGTSQKQLDQVWAPVHQRCQESALLR